MAKQMAALFRAKPISSLTRPILTAARVANMSPGELIAAYDPKNHDSLVGARLAIMSKGHCFLVISDDGTVDQASSEPFLVELIGGFPPRQFAGIGGRVTPLFPIGPIASVVDENPFYPGMPLRPDGTCDKTHLSWATVPLSTRQFARLVRGVIGGGFQIGDAHYVFDYASKGMDALAARYPEVSRTFNELAELAQLPPLKMRMGGGSKVKVAANNPFQKQSY